MDADSKGRLQDPRPLESNLPLSGLAGKHDFGGFPASREQMADWQLAGWAAEFLAKPQAKPFFLAVGLAAHALDELRGRPLRTTIQSGVLVAVVAAGLLGALVLGVFGVIRVGWTLIPFMVAGPVLVIAYNAELFGGLMHTDFGFALAWGAFPVLTAYVAQTGTLALAPVLAAAGAYALSAAQRQLSTPARNIRRRAHRVEGTINYADGRTEPVTADTLLQPLERALRAASWAIILLAAALAVARLT